MGNSYATHQEKLNLLLSKIQKEEQREEFIYGVTGRAKRSFWKRIDDFFIDHSKVSKKERAYFFDLLGTMVRAGIPINKALKILVSKTGSKRLRRVIATLAHELEHGRSLSSALERFPDIFEDTERGIIRSAEAVGNLEQILNKIADNLNRRVELTSRFISAIIYPLAVVCALLVGTVIMLVFVIPKIKAIFAESSISLPLSTKILLGLSTFVTQFWWLLLILIIFGFITFHFYSNSEQGRFSWDFYKLRIPLFGNILRKIIVVRFADILGLLTDSGLPINKALEYTANALGNEIYRIKTYTALDQIQSGDKLSASLGAAPFLFPEAVTNMIAVGEQTATLGELLRKIGAQYEREIDYTLKNMTTVLGPLLILIIGIIVAFFALAVLSPIFSLTQAVR